MIHKKLLVSILTLGAVAICPITANALSAPIRIGVSVGPHSQILKAVQESVAGDDLQIDIIEYKDTGRLNADLAAGKLDANSFQDIPYLQSQIKTNGYQLVDVAYTVTLPMGYYSKRIKSFGELKEGDIIAIPDDPISRARALILLNNYGLIRIEDSSGLQVSPDDIIFNPKQLKFHQLDKERISSALKDVAAAALIYPTAEALGLYPARDSVAMEDGRSPFAHVLVTRSEDKEKPWVTKLANAYHSKKIKEFIMTQFQDSVRRPW